MNLSYLLVLSLSILSSYSISESWSPAIDLQSRAIIKNLYQLADLAQIEIQKHAPNDNLVDQIDEIEEQIETECQQIEDVYTNDIGKAQEQLNEYQQDLDLVQDQLSDQNTKITSLHNQITDLTQQNQDLTSKQGQIQTDLDTLQSQLQHSIEQLEQLNKKFTDQIAADTKGISMVNDFIILIKTPNSNPDLESTWNQILKVLSSNPANDIQARLGKIQADIDKYRVQGAKERQDTKSRLLNSARQLTNDLQKDVTNQQNTQKSTNQNHAQQQTKLQNDIESQSDLLETISEQLEDLGAQIQELNSDLKDVQDNLNEITGEGHDLEVDISEIKNGITELELNHKSHQDTCFQYENQLDTIRHYLKTHPPNALQQSCKPGDQDCPLCLYDYHCPNGLQCSKFAICYNATISKT